MFVTSAFFFFWISEVEVSYFETEFKVVYCAFRFLCEVCVYHGTWHWVKAALRILKDVVLMSGTLAFIFLHENILHLVRLAIKFLRSMLKIGKNVMLKKLVWSGRLFCLNKSIRKYLLEVMIFKVPVGWLTAIIADVICVVLLSPGTANNRIQLCCFLP